MFDWVHNNRRIIQVVLFLCFLPFVFVGVDSYFRGGDFGGEVARVGDARISQQEFQQALKERQESVQRMLGGGRLDPAVLDSPEMRFSAIEQIVRERLLLSQAVRNGLVVTDAALRDVIASQEVFQEGGSFSAKNYDLFLRSQNMTPAMFEARIRRDLLQRPLLDAIGDGATVSSTVVERLVRLSDQTREVSLLTYAPSAYLAKAQIDDAAVKAYYDSHPAEFQVPEQVKIEYVALSLDNLAAQTELAPEAARAVYYQNPTRFSAAEERETSHILVRIPEGAAADAKAAARAKAEAIAKRVREKPASFAEVAKSDSEDPGSAASGGELGFIPRGVTKMKAFDDALFGMKPGEIAGPVETEFGLHVIRLVSVRGGKIQSFEEVRSQIEAELKRQQASKRYAELAEQLNNIVYEQSDSLKPAADLLKVSLQQSPWLSRKPVPGSPLGGERFLNAVFAEDVLKNKRNSEAVEVAPGTIVAARLLEHKPTTTRAFEEVSGDIRKRLVQNEALKQASAEGQAVLERLRKGEDPGAAWSKSQTFGRAGAQGIPESVVRAAFRASATKLPAYTGVEDPQSGYHVIRVSRVTEPEAAAADTRKAVTDQLRQILSQEQLTNYIATLKAGADVQIKSGVIEKKQ
jgi:peptidyl-prolyl cis-trans isomerase D